MPNSDPASLGQTLAKLRLSRGLTQQQVANRVRTYYSDGGTYGRIERGERKAERDPIIAVLVRGLLINDVDEINRVLVLAGYESLSTSEIEQLSLSQPTSIPPPPGEPEKVRLTRRSWSALLSSMLVACLAALPISPGAWFALLSSSLYACLYVVSVYLESAFEPRPAVAINVASEAFGLIFGSSMMGLAADRLLVDSGSSFALPIAFAIFLVAAVAQFLVVRPALSESPIVPANFQTQTAQGAHLKNTGYYLLLVVVFWLPSFHCIATLSHQIRTGQTDWVRQVIQQDLMMGRGLLALSVRSLLLLLLIVLLISLYMRHVLLDNLRQHARMNAFILLFNLRALLYFLLGVICVGWYAAALSGFR